MACHLVEMNEYSSVFSLFIHGIDAAAKMKRRCATNDGLTKSMYSPVYS